MNFLLALQELDEVWNFPKNLIGLDMMFLVNFDPTVNKADLIILFPSYFKFKSWQKSEITFNASV